MNIRLILHAVKRLSRRGAVRLLAAVAISSVAVSMPSVASENMPLAINGYDPVAYFTTGKPARGQPEIEHEWDGHRYRFSRTEHRDLFKSDPVRYAPQFANFCAMALSKGMLVVANPEYWLISDDKLYVFGSPPPAGPALFQKDLEGNIARANKNRPLTVKR
jgi:hypothetical protein